MLKYVMHIAQCKKKLYSRPPIVHPKLWVYRQQLQAPLPTMQSSNEPEVRIRVNAGEGEWSVSFTLFMVSTTVMLHDWHIFECNKTSDLWPCFICCGSDRACVHICTQGYICNIIWTLGKERSWERYEDLAWLNCVYVLWSTGDPSRLYCCLSPSDPQHALWQWIGINGGWWTGGYTGDLWGDVCWCCAKSLKVVCQSHIHWYQHLDPNVGVEGGVHLSSRCCCSGQMPFDHHEHYLLIPSQSWQNKLKMVGLVAHAGTESISLSSRKWRALSLLSPPTCRARLNSRLSAKILHLYKAG